jgi:hypothetical protein
VLAFAMAVGVGLDWPAASAALRDLRQAYPGQSLRIRSFKGDRLDSACGLYAVGSRSNLKYLEQADGLFAERTAGQWSAAGEDNPPEKGWAGCMGRSGRNHALDIIVAPVVVLIMNLTPAG